MADVARDPVAEERSQQWAFSRLGAEWGGCHADQSALGRQVVERRSMSRGWGMVGLLKDHQHTWIGKRMSQQHVAAEQVRGQHKVLSVLCLCLSLASQSSVDRVDAKMAR